MITPKKAQRMADFCALNSLPTNYYDATEQNVPPSGLHAENNPNFHFSDKS